ncbi:TonB-dependent hemoglobin/transferrin/lactoferrin family receptor [Piscinibacter sakaiensis]|uniref:TonB-dependent hemoglobin/transferrin/lactoferrin family receptor n=1 Tax=Piscinibacter sakaiensis TaxID=1547922 RepID=UPI001E576482|nr:TonB-dependent hemoglobin/transferrin/lactoferrin family receptor [Piscinibacter sakaiensis]
MPTALAALAVVPAVAQTVPATPLAELTNTATRTERAVDSLPATVTLKSAAEAEARGVRDLKDLFRDEVDLTVRQQAVRFTAAGSSAGRAGNEGLNIRGLEGNQVLVLVDGVRAPQAYAFGAFASGRLDTLFVDALAQAEVLRGPASTAYGSDGLAGALALRTLEPADLLTGGRVRAGFVRLGANSVDDSGALTAALAGRSGGLQWLALASRRQGHALDNQGTDASEDSRRTRPNPMDLAQNGLLAKARLALTPVQSLGLALEAVHRRSGTEVFSGRSVPSGTPAATAVVDLDGRDRQSRERVALDWQFDDLNAVGVQQAGLKLYGQDTRIRQVAEERRQAAADRLRDGAYRERLVGLSAQASASFSGVVAQRVSVGLDASENRIRALRDGTVPPFGESFPSKPFPDTRYRLVGAFVQSEMQFGRDAALQLIPGLRFDHYALEPDAAGYTASPVVRLSDQAVTPRLGAVWRVSEALAPYAQWSRGFRAPAPDQVNNGFSNPTSGYRSIGNAGLKAERAESVELGLRGRAGTLGWQLAAYDNRYRDFISQEIVGGSFTPADPAVFQYVNLAEAHIRGTEVRLNWTPTPAWRLKAAYARSRGDSSSGGVSRPLLSIEPARLSLGLEHERGAITWRASLLHVRGKEASEIPSATPASFAPPSYTTLDLGARWKASRALTLHLALDNLTDATYWRWSDVRGLAGNSAVKDAFTAPGRSVSLTARLDF